MPSLPASLDNLITFVRSLHPEGGPLERLTDAMTAADQLSEQADSLIGYFVDQARASGASWTQIGSAMGVSKQAAQKRFVIRDEPLVPEGKAFSRFTPRARAAVAGAGQLAAAAGADAIDVVHLAAGSLTDADGLAARAIHRLEVTDDQVYRALGVGPAEPGSDPDPIALRELHFTSASRDALKGALKAALRLSHNYIGTEHLLLGVIAGGGSVSDALSSLGLTASLIDSAVAVEVAAAQLDWKRRAG